ncbi:MAG: septum formation initiator family protein [Bacteriovoracia bacterium]
MGKAKSFISHLTSKGSSRSIKWFVVFSVFFVWVISISGFFGNKGLLQAYSLSEARRDLRLRIVARENEKQRLEEALRDLQENPAVQEKNIRETLGYVRNGDLVFEFK